MSKRKVCHLTSVHVRKDTRILIKQCTSLANHNYDVSLVVADGLGDELVGDVNISDVGAPSGRLNRMMVSTNKVYLKALSIDAELYHIHDPELLIVALRLKRKGKKVIFDSHEDVPSQILSKTYINKYLKVSVSRCFGLFERKVLARIDGVVAATPYIRDKFIEYGIAAVDINNYPIISEFTPSPDSSLTKKNVCYVGAISTTRGPVEMLLAIDKCNSETGLSLGGKFNEPKLEKKLKAMPGWERVDFKGWLTRADVSKVMAQAIAGLVVLHPTRSYVESLPVKMFEYMSAGIPVIASDFPIWRSIIDDANCGLCVDPMNPVEVAEAIDYLSENPDVAQKMGINGRKAVEEKYCWQNEEQKLIILYSRLFN